MEGCIVKDRSHAPSQEDSNYLAPALSNVCPEWTDTLDFSRKARIFMKKNYLIIKLGKIIEHFINTV